MKTTKQRRITVKQLERLNGKLVDVTFSHEAIPQLAGQRVACQLHFDPKTPGSVSVEIWTDSLSIQSVKEFKE